MMKIIFMLLSNNDIHKSVNTFRKVEFLILKLKNGACSNETPVVIVGNSKYPFFSEIFFATSDTISESVEMGKCGPCCSTEPIGITAICFSFN